MLAKLCAILLLSMAVGTVDGNIFYDDSLTFESTIADRSCGTKLRTLAQRVDVRTKLNIITLNKLNFDIKLIGTLLEFLYK